MALNESSSKLDNTLDKVCKKFEKICFETGSTDLRHVDPIDDTKILTYREYIEQFSWDFRKYNTKLSLGELCQTISKKMKDNESLIKTYFDDVNNIKTKLGAYVRKDTGNYMTRDFFDDIYTSESIEKRHFVQGYFDDFESEKFTNLLCVVPKMKYQLFLSDTIEMMDDFYQGVDATELKRRPDQAKSAFNELREKGQEAIETFLEHHEMSNMNPEKLKEKFHLETAV